MRGLALDLGTTTLVAYLCDLDNGRIVETYSMLNPQLEAGADVLSRISYANQSAQNSQKLTTLLGAAIEALIRRFEPIDRLVLVGNPVIMGSIREYPVESLCQETYRIPPIGGYVGADALAAAFLLNQDRHMLGDRACKEKRLLVDIGTNTEIVLLTDQAKIATSAAAGPAMEGGNISCGMVALEGAIELFRFPLAGQNADMAFKTIGAKERGEYVEPKGICGSGLFSLLCGLKDVGLVDESGYLLSRDEALRNNAAPRMVARIMEQNSEHASRFFRITDSIYLSQEDIRNLQLSFAAIRAGIDCVLKEASMVSTELDMIYVAGSFGSRVGLESLTKLNICPDIGCNRICQAGNLAGLGAASLLMNPERIDEARELGHQIRVLSLAAYPGFQEAFVKQMHL